MTVDLITVMIFDLLMVFREFSILISVCVCAFWIAALFIAVFPDLLCLVLAYHIGLFTNMKKNEYFKGTSVGEFINKYVSLYFDLTQ